MPRTAVPEIDKFKERVLHLKDYEAEALCDYLKLLIEVRRDEARKKSAKAGA